MSAYLDEEAIASALKITPEAVRDILNGQAQVEELKLPGRGTSIQINTEKTAYRQKIIAVWRSRGGVGCTAIACHLADYLKEMMSVLLIDLNFTEGGSDLSYHLNLPEYPNMGAFSVEHPQHGILEAGKNLFVAQSPLKRYEIDKIGPETVNDLITFARQNFDAVVLDLPNSETEHVRVALNYANVLIMVIAGAVQETVRTAIKLQYYDFKDQLVVLNNNKINTIMLKNTFNIKHLVTIPHDEKLAGALEKQRLAGKKSAFGQGITRIKNILYREQTRKGIFGLFAGN